MASGRALAERAAKRNFRTHPDRMRFLRQIKQESGFRKHPISRAGARGIAQIMPATARGWGVNPDNPSQALDAAAKHMRQYLKAYGGSWAKALTAYNAGPGAVGRPLPAETRNYIRTILGGRGDAKAGPGGSGGGGGFPGFGGVRGQSVKMGMETTFDRAGFEKARKASIVGQLLARRHGTRGVLFKSGLLSTQAPDPSEFVDSRLVSKIVQGKKFGAIPAFGGGRGGGGGAVKGHTTVRLAPGADRAGVKTSHYLRRVLSGVAGIPGGITITTGSNHNQMTVNGNVSDHWTGHAADIAVPVDSRRGDLIAGRVLMRLGVPRARARQMARRGGLFNVSYGGKRWQVIWRTNAGGNHHNHIHVGVR